MLGCAAASIFLLVASISAAAAGGTYFPLSAGNWWSYEELDGDGRALSRETWTVLEATAGKGTSSCVRPPWDSTSAIRRRDATGSSR